MSWKSLINLTGTSKERHPRTLHDDSSQQSWCPSPSRPLTRSSTDVSGSKVVSDQPRSPLYGKLSPADGVISCLKNKSTDELRKLASDKDAYNRFFNSLEQVKIQNKVRDELQTETLQLARENLEKGPRLLELRNQCTIIRTSELAHAQEKLNHLERKMENMIMTDSYSSLLQKLRDSVDRAEEESEVLHRKLLADSVDRAEEESEVLHRKLLANEIDLAHFLRNYKNLRIIHHRRSLLHLAAQTSV